MPSVGHCHPRVVEAIAAQARLLNTHTRYLHENVVKLAERLGSKLASDLSVSWFVCSGTEANELATRIARVVTGHHGMVVTEGAYHGNSDLVRTLSTDSYPAAERPDWLGVVEAPNMYRGSFREADDPGRGYASLVSEAVDGLAASGYGPAAMLVDLSWDANGVLIAPDDYLARGCLNRPIGGRSFHRRRGAGWILPAG